jgi:hypothetical protein
MPAKKRARQSREEREAKRLQRNEAYAASLQPEIPPKDPDQMRLILARRIEMFIGNRKRYWRNCKERCCRRASCCMAPEGCCSNAPPLPPDPTGERRARVMAMVQRAVRERLARLQADDTNVPKR